MSQPSANIVDAVSGAEVCPLCFDLFTAADECTCVVCRVASCPGCAEVLDADGAVRCFACRPAQAAARLASVVTRGPELEPLSLPRPIHVSVGAPASAPAPALVGLPSLPFPLTTSPQGVRVLKRKPAGSVFVGLPAVAPALNQALRALEPSQPSEPAVVQQGPKLTRRAQQKLALLSQIASLLALRAARLGPLALRGRQLAARLGPLASRGRQLAVRLGPLASRGRQLAARLGPLTSRGRQLAAQATLQTTQLTRAFVARLPEHRATALKYLALARVRLGTARAWIETHGEPLAKQLAKQVTAKLERLHLRQKPAVVVPDPSRPIQL